MIRLQHVKIKDIVFYLGCLLMIIYKFSGVMPIFEGTFFRTYFFLFTGVILVVLFVLISGFTIIDILLIAYGLFSFFWVKDTTLLTFLILVVAIKNRDFDEVVTFYFHIQSFILSICIILYPVLYVARISYAQSSVIAGRFRYNFFFTHPNNFAIQVVFTVLAYIYIKRKTLSYWGINVILIITSIFLYVFPNSQSATIILIIYGVSLLLMRNFKILWKPFVKIVLPVLIISTIYIVYSFYNEKNTELTSYIRGTFSVRFIGAAKAFLLYDLNLFGNKMTEIGQTLYLNGRWESFWFDLAYARIILAFGIIGGGIFYFFLFRTMYILIKEKNYDVLLLFICILFYALSEWTAFSTLTVFPLLFMSKAIDKKHDLS